ncbi:MAG TPA: potassium-transporting ATPase subunit KdpC [Actinomycetota bacterium]|jgi:potassium-transporting ATPase KdpC subunit
MLTDLRRGLIALAVFTVVTGLAYPLVVFAAGQLAFRGAADGSLVVTHGKVVGSRLIGQPFSDPRYFWGRPSAAGQDGYDPTASGASNLGPTSRKLADTVARRLAALLEANPGKTAADVPAELVTASGSGLDPDISPAAAEFQVDRVARARGLDPAAVRRLVRAHTRGRALGLLGEPRVNVLELNLALDGEAR